MLLPPSFQGSTVSRETVSALIPSRLNTAPAARTVEDWVIWTYQSQRAHKVEDRLARAGYPMGHASRCSAARVAEAAALGAVIHGTGTSSALHADAEMLHDLVRSPEFDDTERGLVIFFGETGVAPDWMPGAKPGFRPVLNGRNKPAMIFDRNNNAIACRVELTQTQQEINERRGYYTTWWFAMAKLACLLRIEGLASCQDPAAKQRPWL